MSEQYDIVIVGGGPGGYVSAIRASQLGMSVAVVESSHLGGICLNWGCIPTKALLHVSEVMREIRHAGDLGIKVGEPDFDLAKVIERSRKVSAQLNKGVGMLLKRNKVKVYDGRGVLGGKSGSGHKILVSKDGKAVAELVSKHVILACGARARELDGLVADGKRVWNYRHALQPPYMPKSLIVIGSGAIGIEFASFYSGMGSDVTVIEMLDRILPQEDSEISAMAEKSFVKQGMKILTSAKIAKSSVSGDGVSLTMGDGVKVEGDTIISAIGIVGNVEDLGFEHYSGIEVDRAHVVVDEWSFTGESGIYAIGDLAGAPWLAHKAEHEGVIAVERIAGVENLHPLDLGGIAGCTYCYPQVASVGMTEAEAESAGYDLRIGRFPFVGNGKAIALGESEGMVKTIFDAGSGELLGAHMIGVGVTELIQGYVIARGLETTEVELMHTVFPHPTLSEMMHESVLAAFGRAIHV